MGEKEWREINAKIVILSRVGERSLLVISIIVFFKFYIISSKCHLNVIQLNADCMLIMVNCSLRQWNSSRLCSWLSRWAF